MLFSFSLSRALVLACSGIFFYLPFFALGAGAGDVVINEIAYDLKGADDKHEWVEIYNASLGDVDITGWKFNDGSNHLLNAPPKNGGRGTMVIPAGGYAVFADDAVVFLTDHPGFSGAVIDSAFSLKNTEATLTLFDDNGVSIDSALYRKDLGGAGNGMTLERISATAGWKESAQEGGTPGAPNSGLSVITAPVIQVVQPVVPELPPAPIPQAPIEQVAVPVSGDVPVEEIVVTTDTHQQITVAVEPPVIKKDEIAPSEVVSPSAPVKNQTEIEQPQPTAKKIAKNEAIVENDASAGQPLLQNENTQKNISQPALASRAFGQSIYALIAGAFGLVVWLSLRRRPEPVVEETEREE